MKTYEAMFLVDPAQALDWEKVEGEIRGVIERHGGTVINIGKWAERKLEYPIRHHKRATYILTHFEADGDSIPMMRRDAELSETILRYIILVDEDGVEWSPLEDGRTVPATTPAAEAKEEAAPAETEKKEETVASEEPEAVAAEAAPAEETSTEEGETPEDAPAEEAQEPEAAEEEASE